ADQFGMGDHPGVVGGDVVPLHAGSDAVGGDGRPVRGERDHHVVAHRRDRQLAGVAQGDGELGARGGHGDRADVVAHRVIALDRGGTVADHRLARSLRRRCRGGWVCGGRRIGGASGVRRLRVRGGRFGRCRRRGRRFGGRGGRGGGRRCIAPASGQRKGAGDSQGGEFRVHGGSPVQGGGRSYA